MAGLGKRRWRPAEVLEYHGASAAPSEAGSRRLSSPPRPRQARGMETKLQRKGTCANCPRLRFGMNCNSQNC